MPQANVMAWNLEKLNEDRASTVGVRLIQFIASVMQLYRIDLIGLSGIFAGRGESLAGILSYELNNREKTDNKWQDQTSPALGLGWNEQYCFVWNSLKFQPATTHLTDRFQYDYPLPDGLGKFYGFPRLRTAAADLPPYLGYFQLVGTQKFLPIAVFHAPDWALAEGIAVELACKSLAEVAAFDQGHGCLLMGTFNVPANDNVTVNGSNGAKAFATLAGANGKYTQTMNNQPNQLASGSAVGLAMENALAQTADNIFFRRNGTINGIIYTDARLVNVFLNTLGAIDETERWTKAPLGAALAAIEAHVFGQNSVSADPDGSYVLLGDAFLVYRYCVSGYLPVAITINY
ncbi:hypothetical protein NIES4101_25980 (plasmid) [Calothrix sp. NIES-4101]|nr:hypothetical protein NIES4101_25980 [Calothrix sp. NIES-4101]